MPWARPIIPTELAGIWRYWNTAWNMAAHCPLPRAWQGSTKRSLCCVALSDIDIAWLEWNLDLRPDKENAMKKKKMLADMGAPSFLTFTDLCEQKLHRHGGGARWRCAGARDGKVIMVVVPMLPAEHHQTGCRGCPSKSSLQWRSCFGAKGWVQPIRQLAALILWQLWPFAAGLD